MIINGAWAVESLPNHYILDIPGLGLKLAFITPFRALTVADLTPYEGYHPRKLRGVPLPAYLYRFYGLEKDTETASEVLHIRVTPTEKAKIEQAASDGGMTTGEYVRRRALSDD